MTVGAMFAAAAAATVAFPRPGQTLPPVSKTYVSGSVPRGTSSLTVQGRPVEIYRTGGWVTMADVSSGTNFVEIAADGFVTNVAIVVEAPPRPAGPPAPPKRYGKLPYAGDLQRPHPCGKPASETLVFLDPGHGGPKDTGAVSPHGYFEKEANLLLAREVRRALLAMGYRVEMTRDADIALELLERPRRAHEIGADCYVSLHHNATQCDKDPREIRYTSVYRWNGIGERLAAAISRRTGAALSGDIPDNGVMKANFAVTRSPEVPSCLVEADFITTPEGEEAIWNAARRRRIAEAIALGIDDWRRSSAPGDDGGDASEGAGAVRGTESGDGGGEAPGGVLPGSGATKPAP